MGMGNRELSFSGLLQRKTLIRACTGKGPFQDHCKGRPSQEEVSVLADFYIEE
jgi:hypothetical protein